MSKLSQSTLPNKLLCALCKCPIRQDDTTHFHHPKPKSEGGIETVEVHQSCHIEHHSSQGDFKSWGRQGGIKTASMMLWIFNLKYKGGPPDPLRWIPFGR